MYIFKTKNANAWEGGEEDCINISRHASSCVRTRVNEWLDKK